MTDNAKLAALNIVPFGKYRGQPIEVLAQDRPYLEWLSAQDWFRQRYAGIYTLIVNNFADATETPDHNALQVLFLEDDFCERFLTIVRPCWMAENIKKLSDEIVARRQHFIHLAEGTWGGPQRKAEAEAALRKYDEVTLKWEISFHREFEQKGVDVVLGAEISTTEDLPSAGGGLWPAKVWSHIPNIEIKPTVSDDCPTVLRQMRANRSAVLFIENYAGVGATKEQFIKTFALSKIVVVFRRDVDAVQVKQHHELNNLWKRA